MKSSKKAFLQINGLKSTKKLKRFVSFIIGCLILSIAYNLFLNPNKLVPGGVGGIAIILNRKFEFENSTTILLMNIGLLFISYMLLGKDKTRATILGAILFPLFIKLTENINVWVQIDTSQILLSSVFGGIMYGIGIGMVFKAGFTTGGTDIINHIISKYVKVSTGQSMLFVDGIIVLIAGMLFGMSSAMYSILILYIISIVSDRVLLGISDSKAFFIITSKEDVKAYIINELKHGVTEFKATGGYKQEEQTVLMTVLPTKDYWQLKDGIKKLDPKAIYIITDTYEVFGGK